MSEVVRRKMYMLNKIKGFKHGKKRRSRRDVRSINIKVLITNQKEFRGI
jgi:hypothetical protein